MWLLSSVPPDTVDFSTIPSSVIVAFISVVGTFGAAFLMFRGKTQDTANWLIKELRTEIRDARAELAQCVEMREEVRREIHEIQVMLQEERMERKRLERLLEEKKC